MSLPDFLRAARKQSRLEFDNEQLQTQLQADKQPSPPVELTIVPNPPAWQGDSALQMLCAAIRDGVYLLDLLNIFLAPKDRRAVWRPGGVSEVLSIATDVVSIGDSVVEKTVKVASDVTDQATKVTMEAAKHVPGGAEAAAAVERGIALTTESAHMLGHAGGEFSAAQETQDLLDRKTCRPNVASFIAALKDEALPFKMHQSVTFNPDDLLHYDRGKPADQDRRQHRVLKCLLAMATEVNQMSDYLGPKLDEVNLGSLGPGDFFGELALLPLRSPWHHRRTTTAVQNSLLYFISKRKIELLWCVAAQQLYALALFASALSNHVHACIVLLLFRSDRFPDLRHSLEEHASDYEAAQSQGVGKATAKNAFKT